MRIVGVDDGAFQSKQESEAAHYPSRCAISKLRISCVRVGRIEVDGTDANKVLASLLRSLRYDVVMLSGISFGGFNVVDISQAL